LHIAVDPPSRLISLKGADRISGEKLLESGISLE